MNGSDSTNTAWFEGRYGLMTAFDLPETLPFSRLLCDTYWATVPYAVVNEGINGYQFVKSNRFSLSFRLSQERKQLFKYGIQSGFWFDIEALNTERWVCSPYLELSEIRGDYFYPIAGWQIRLQPNVVLGASIDPWFSSTVKLGGWLPFIDKLVASLEGEGRFTVGEAPEESALLQLHYIGMPYLAIADYAYVTLGLSMVLKELFSQTTHNPETAEPTSTGVFLALGLYAHYGYYALTGSPSFEWLPPAVELRFNIISTKNEEFRYCAASIGFGFAFTDQPMGQYNVKASLSFGLPY